MNYNLQHTFWFILFKSIRHRCKWNCYWFNYRRNWDIFTRISNFNIAAFKGKTDLAIGNVIGSNLLNQLLILGSCSIFSGFKGLVIEQSLIKVDLPFMVLTTFACLPIFWTKGKITRFEGFILINFYIFYILDKILFLNGFNYLSELRIGLFIYFSLLIVILFAQEKLKFSSS